MSKNFRELRAHIAEASKNPQEVDIAGDPEGGDVNEPNLDTSNPRELKHVRQFMKHPVALDHQFNGSREAVGIPPALGEEVEETDEGYYGKKKKKKMEDAVEDLENVKEDTAFELEDGSVVEVNEDVASRLLKVHSKLNKENQQEFVKNLTSGEGAFADMVDFSQGVE